MVDEKQLLTKKQRRQRQKPLEKALRCRRDGINSVPASNQGPSTATDEDASEADRPGRLPQSDLTAADVQGWKYFEKISPLLERRHPRSLVRRLLDMEPLVSENDRLVPS